MNIFVQNLSSKVSDEEALKVVAALQIQADRDYTPHWNIPASLEYLGKQPPPADDVSKHDTGIVYLQDKADIEGALGYHDLTAKGLPVGFVFLDIAAQIGEPWPNTASHEILEMLGDIDVNVLYMGPHPTKKRNVMHWGEMCNAVQAQSYQIDGVTVSNFVLPPYFRTNAEAGVKSDFMGSGLKPFGVNRGGYIGFYDPRKGDHETYMLKGDAEAARRFNIKSERGLASRSQRYEIQSRGGLLSGAVDRIAARWRKRRKQRADA